MKQLPLSNLLSIGVLALGACQMTGFLVGSKAVRGIGAASAASPFPKVFCSAPIHGEPNAELETFASEFTLIYQHEGQEVELPVTPQVYSRLAGPYNRRNVYGAALAYGPCLPPDLRRSIIKYALSEPGSLKGELGLPDQAENLRIRVAGVVGDTLRSWEFNEEGETL